MVKDRRWTVDEADEEAERRTHELIEEFQRHYTEYVSLHPQDVDRKRDIFESWAIQKIAGLQLCIEHIAEQVNHQIKGDGQP